MVRPRKPQAERWSRTICVRVAFSRNAGSRDVAAVMPSLRSPHLRSALFRNRYVWLAIGKIAQAYPRDGSAVQSMFARMSNSRIATVG